MLTTRKEADVPRFPPHPFWQEDDLKDTANTLASPGLLQFAKDAKLWDPSQGPFVFAKAFHSNSASDKK